MAPKRADFVHNHLLLFLALGWLWTFTNSHCMCLKNVNIQLSWMSRFPSQASKFLCPLVHGESTPGNQPFD